MPHIMKHQFLILISLGLMAFGLNSCLDNAQSHYTPSLYFTDFYVNPVFSHDTLMGASDTLLASYDTLLNVYVLDTIHFSDSIIFGLACETYSNNLTAVRINYDTSALAFYANIDDLKPIMTASSKPEMMQLYFNPGYNLVTFGVGYKGKKAGSYTLEFVGESDSDLSPTKYVLVQPVAE